MSKNLISKKSHINKLTLLISNGFAVVICFIKNPKKKNLCNFNCKNPFCSVHQTAIVINDCIPDGQLINWILIERSFLEMLWFICRRKDFIDLHFVEMRHIYDWICAFSLVSQYSEVLVLQKCWRMQVTPNFQATTGFS